MTSNALLAVLEPDVVLQVERPVPADAPRVVRSTTSRAARRGMYRWLDLASLGRNENGIWFRRHDEYDGE